MHLWWCTLGQDGPPGCACGLCYPDGMTSTILVTQHIDLDASAYSVRVRGDRGHE